MISSAILFKSVIEDDSSVRLEGTHLLNSKQDDIENRDEDFDDPNSALISFLILIDFPVHVETTGLRRSQN